MPQEKQLKDTEKKDKYRIYGEMLNTYGYSLEPGAKSLKCINYYTNEEIQVPLDSQLSAHENSVKYFDRYAKLKTYMGSPLRPDSGNKRRTGTSGFH